MSTLFQGRLPYAVRAKWAADWGATEAEIRRTAERKMSNPLDKPRFLWYNIKKEERKGISREINGNPEGRGRAGAHRVAQEDAGNPGHRRAGQGGALRGGRPHHSEKVRSHLHFLQFRPGYRSLQRKAPLHRLPGATQKAELNRPKFSRAVFFRFVQFPLDKSLRFCYNISL